MVVSYQHIALSEKSEEFDLDENLICWNFSLWFSIVSGIVVG